MIRLPNYHEHPDLNDLRRSMRAELIEWREHRETGSQRISAKDLRALETAGLEINLADIETLRDGTFTFQGERVLLYIMQPSRYGRYGLPKYHIANCSTWEEMKAKGRKDRYVASRRVDGIFELDIVNETGSSREEHRLDVCKNCLDRVSWKGYASGAPGRKRIFRDFSLTEFFEVKKSSLIREKPRYTPETMPSANYTDDFSEISSAARIAANWKCSSCKRSFTKTFERKYLHVHHRNGIKGDNSPENLYVLCLGCHADQPDHMLMKRSPDYFMFMALMFMALFGTADEKGKFPAP